MNEHYRECARRTLRLKWVYHLLRAGVAVGTVGCRSSELLNVPTPPNVVGQGSLADTAGAEAMRGGAIGDFTAALQTYGGVLEWAGILSDEIRLENNAFRGDIAVDARSITISSDGHTSFDGPYTALQAARVLSLQAVAALERHPTAHAPTEIGELFALAAFSEIILGETVCSGVPLSQLTPAGAVTYGDPLPTDSVFARALIHFDSATAHAGADPIVGALAATGRGRALLNLGRFAEAGAAVPSVPTTFSYGTQLLSTVGQGFYSDWSGGPDLRAWTVGDHKGQTGLDFVSARDSRLVTINQGTSYVGLPAYYPAKFPVNTATNDSVPLADGVEAQLVAAEAALNGGNTGAWLGTLNQLRANFVTLRGPYPSDTGYHQLGPLSDPGTDSGRVSLMFRERAFWLYGTAHRLGDLRRLVRQYGRDQSAVFPTGPYDNGSASALFPSYGISVNFPIGAVEIGNPKFHGCSSTAA